MFRSGSGHIVAVADTAAATLRSGTGTGMTESKRFDRAMDTLCGQV